jgi:nucleoid DNA-binding protein
MDKTELLELLKEDLKFESKKEAEEFIKKIDLLVEKASEKLSEKTKVKIGKYITIENAFVGERSGNSPKGGAWTKPAHYEYKVRNTKALNKEAE